MQLPIGLLEVAGLVLEVAFGEEDIRDNLERCCRMDKEMAVLGMEESAHSVDVVDDGERGERV